MATRTWVSGVGDDVNPCSRTAPCKTFAGAISKTVAGGEIDALDPGGYGAVTITKSITIDGSGGFASILASGTNGVIINGAGIAVRLRRLNINGAGNGLTGIRILNAAKVHIEDCAIFGFTAGVARGIDDLRNGGGLLFVNNTVVRDNGQSGIVIRPAAGSVAIQAFIDRVLLKGNGNAGLEAGNGSRVTISNSVIASNTNFGLLAGATVGTAELNAETNMVLANGVGIKADTGSTIRISNQHVIGNTTGLAGPGAFDTFGNSKVAANSLGNTVPGAPPIVPSV
jgi:hypothetical protein